MIRKAALALLAAPALAAPATAVRAQQSPTTIRFIYAPSDDLVPFWYAQSTGMFGRAGLNIEVSSVATGAIVGQAVLSGAADIGRTSPQALIAGHIRGIPMVAVAPGAIHRHGVQGNAAIMVAASSPIKNFLELQGKTASCTAIGDIGYLGLRSLIDAAGGDSTKVKWIEIPISAVAPALEQGRVDAGLQTEPFMTRDIAAGKVRILVDMLDGYPGSILQGVFIATKSYAQSNAEAIARFENVLRQAATYSNTHPNETLDILVKNTGIEADVASKMRRAQLALQWDAALMQPLIDVAAKYKQIPQDFSAAELWWTAK